VSELRPELAVIGTDLKTLKEKLAEYDQNLIDLQQDIKDIKEVNLDQQKALAALQRFHFSGYLQLRYDALLGDGSLFKSQGAGGTGIRPTTGAPHVGGPAQGFILRRGRFKLDGTLNPKDSFAFQFDFGTAGPLHLRDMWADVKSGLPHNWSFRMGQFPPPFTYTLPSSSRLREAPERALGFSDSSNANFIFKDTVSATGGTITPGTVILQSSACHHLLRVLQWRGPG
jgi:Phosphate-selective porin O and P